MNEKRLNELQDFCTDNYQDAKGDGNNEVAEIYADLTILINEAFIELNQ